MSTPKTVTSTPIGLPPSATSIPINLCGLLGAIGCTAWIWITHPHFDSITAVIFILISYSLPIVLLECVLRRSRNSLSTGLDYKNRRPMNSVRIATKIVGLYIVLGICGVFYWLFPVYHSQLYRGYFTLLSFAIPLLVVLAIPYFALMDKFLLEPKDSYWYCGRIFSGQFKEIDKKKVGQLILGWIVKAFFLPLMFTSLSHNIGLIIRNNIFSDFATFGHFFNFAWLTLFTLDVLVATAGYFMTFRILDSHIRTAEPTMIGWVVTLICYEPFWSLVGNQYLKYEDPTISWTILLPPASAIYVIWGSLILLLLCIYVAASLSFGIRFSNLTNRGILTRGVYSLTKHPSYVSKNLMWWLVSVPFFSHAGLLETIRHCVLLLGVNAVYYLRARTEERHLSTDPIYTQYALAMNERSIFRWVGRLIPSSKFDPSKFEKV